MSLFWFYRFCMLYIEIPGGLMRFWAAWSLPTAADLCLPWQGWPTLSLSRALCPLARVERTYAVALITHPRWVKKLAWWRQTPLFGDVLGVSRLGSSFNGPQSVSEQCRYLHRWFLYVGQRQEVSITNSLGILMGTFSLVFMGIILYLMLFNCNLYPLYWQTPTTPVGWLLAMPNL